MSVPKRLPGMVAGSLVALSFGTVFIMINSGGLPAPWPLAIRVAGGLVAAALVVWLLRTARTAPPVPAVTGEGFVDRRYRLIVAAEAVALFGGLYVINGLLQRPAVSVAWVAVVVGVHFFGLGRIWRMPLYHWLGAVMTILGVAGFAMHALGAGAPAVGLVAGVGSGAALYASVAAALSPALQPRMAGPVGGGPVGGGPAGGGAPESS